MSTAGMNYDDLQLRKKLLLESLQETANELLNRNEVQGAMDIHHPERSPGWKPYRHQEYPKMMYHETRLDPVIEDKRLGVRRRNEANPNLAPMDWPASEPLKIIVKDKAAEDEAGKKGFVKFPPVLRRSEEQAHLDKVSDPLAASVGVIPAPLLSVAEIIELNAMSKDVLAKTAKDKYGIEVSADDTKIGIIDAISLRVAKGMAHV